MRAKPLLFVLLSGAFLCALISPAQDVASARSFLQLIYQQYTKQGKGIDLTGRYYHSSLLALIHADQKAVGQDVPICCDADPVCGCQDWNGIRDLKIDVKTETPERSVAEVSFSLSGPKDRQKSDLRSLEMTLVREHGQWRIYDIEDRSDPKASSDLRKEIQAEIDSYAEPSKGK